MKVRALVGALLLPSLAWSAGPTPDSRDPRIGYWIEERISPAYPQSEGLQLSIEDIGGGRIRYKLGANHDAAHLLQVDARCDGAKYPLVDGNGKPEGRTYSCKVSGPRSVESTTTQVAGKPEATAALVETVSEDAPACLGMRSTGMPAARSCAR